jgi:hypothetical protein
MSAGEKRVISVNLVQGSFLRIVSYGTDANGSTVWADSKKPDGTSWQSLYSVKSSGAGTSANTLGPIPASGNYQFSLYFSTKTYAGTFNLKFLQVDSPQVLSFDKSDLLDFSQQGEGKSFTINMTKGEHVRFVTQSTSNNSTIWGENYNPDGTSQTLYNFRSTGAGTKASDFEAKQTGTFTFVVYYNSAGNLGKVTLTAIKTTVATQAAVGKPTTVSFKKPGERIDIAVKVTRGYMYRLVTNVKDSNASSIWTDYTRPDGTTGTFSFRSSGAGTQVVDLGPMTMTGEYIFSITKSTPSDIGDLTFTLLRVEKATLIKGNTPTTVNFSQPGQAISYAIAANKGDLIQLQTDSAVKELSVTATFVRPDGTGESYYTIRNSGTGKQFDTKEPNGWSQTGFYVFTLRANTPSVIGKMTLTVLGSTNTSTNYVSELVNPEEGNAVVVPIPEESPTPTKTTSALSQAPASVTLDVTTTESDVHTGAVTTVIYNGDIYDAASKPSGFNFYQKNATNGVQELVASVALSDAKCTKKSSTKYSCTFPTFNPYSATKPAAGVPLTVSATNSKGNGGVSNSVGLYAYMVQPIGDNWNLTKWDDVSAAIYGTGMKNWLGFRSREGNSPIEATFIFKGTWPKNPKYNVKFVERRANGTGGDIITVNYSKLEAKQNGINHVVTVPSNNAKIRGDSVYIATIEVMDGTGVAVRGRHSVSFSLDYKMSLGCSSALLILQTVRDTSKATLSTISWALTTTVLIVNETLNKSGVTKLGPAKKLQLEKKLAVLTGYAELAGAGVELIDAEAALTSGDKTIITTTVSGIIASHVKGAVAQRIDKKTGNTILEWELDRQAAVDLLGFLQTQGKANGEFITDNCS